ncbi:MAG: RpiB/LacA/LacB family sugar-phosphate isomerase [Chloroflexota bacterium]|nr:RpiB/LacA/LacB family sugar-phosphate isomerase [Chloroflexota bacterium]
MTIAIAADHAGYTLKQHLVAFLRAQGHDVIDLGVDTAAVPSDYPDIAQLVAAALQDGRAQRGILACGSGVGVSIAANKIPGIYSAVIHDVYSAHQGVEHDRMNVICVGARVIGVATAEEIITAFLKAQPSDEERHVRRYDKMRAIESRSLSDR